MGKWVIPILAGLCIPLTCWAQFTNVPGSRSRGPLRIQTGSFFVPAASCLNNSATSNWDTTSATAPAAACITGTNTNKGVLDFDAAADEAVQITYRLPNNWKDGIDATIVWLSTGTTNNVGWCIQLLCVQDGATDDPAFPTATVNNCISDPVKGTANQLNYASFANLPTSATCVPGAVLHVRWFRDGDGSVVTDNSTADARGVGVELVVRKGK